MKKSLALIPSTAKKNKIKSKKKPIILCNQYKLILKNVNLV
jgi:hypothetical protein